MQAFMWQDELIGIAKFVNMCLNKVSGWKARREDSPPLSGGQQLISLVWLEERCNMI